MVRVLLPCVMAFLAVGATSFGRGKRAVPKRVQRWLGADAAQVLRAGDRVEPFAVWPWPAGHSPVGRDPPVSTATPGSPSTVLGYPVYAAGPVQSGAFAQRLADILLDERSYEADSAPFGHRATKACIPMPVVAFRVWAAQRSVDVLICFRCDQVMIGRRTSRFPNGTELGDTDPSRAALVSLAHQSLPDVPRIQAIPSVAPTTGSRFE
jgi:hypothetical protein